MSENQGFLNAPTVTAFAVGMVVCRSGGQSLGKVVETDERGAYFRRDADIVYSVTDSIPRLRLDLAPERMWVGREYRSKCNHLMPAMILAPPEFTDQGRVYFEGHDDGVCRWSVKDFLSFYEPLPLPERVAESAPDTWEDVCRRWAWAWAEARELERVMVQMVEQRK